ncbi:MAG TPA: ABC transporter ATP-binding protein [Symbiobacteriaceae bacterium]|nr:ABC transporter ATP-binding protein [Symbiobacteriaceae bacterium]
MIAVANLTKHYGGRGGVTGLNLTVAAGEIVGLVGANGAGKSTTLRTLLGLLRPDGGTVAIGAEGLAPDHMRARSQVGYIPEMPELYTDLTAWEHLRFLGMIYGMDSDTTNRRAELLLRRVELWNRRDEDPLSYSKGMRQRLSVACALIHDPQILLADEPWSGLDPLGSYLLKELFAELRTRGKAVLLSTHMLDTAERLCDRFVLLHEGAVAAQGTLEAVRTAAGLEADASLEEAFVAMLRQRRRVVH